MIFDSAKNCGEYLEHLAGVRLTDAEKAECESNLIGYIYLLREADKQNAKH